MLKKGTKHILVCKVFVGLVAVYLYDSVGFSLNFESKYIDDDQY